MLGEGSGWDLTVRPQAAASENLEPGNLGIWRSGDLEIQKIGVQQKKTILKIRIRYAQNVGKVWISRKKSSWPHLGPSRAIFSMDRKNLKKLQHYVYVCLFSLVLQ